MSEEEYEKLMATRMWEFTKGKDRKMIKCAKKIKEVGYFDLDLETNRDVIKKGVVVGIDTRYGECLLLDTETKKIERVPEGCILQGRTLRRLEGLLANYYEDN